MWVKTVLLYGTSTLNKLKCVWWCFSLKATKRKSATLYYGAQTQALMAFDDLFSTWESLGVKVVPVFSKAGDGYVQEAFGGDKENLLTSPDSTGVVLCGQKEMCQEVTEIMTGSGVDKEKIILNF